MYTPRPFHHQINIIGTGMEGFLLGLLVSWKGKKWWLSVPGGSLWDRMGWVSLAPLLWLFRRCQIKICQSRAWARRNSGGSTRVPSIVWALLPALTLSTTRRRRLQVLKNKCTHLSQIVIWSSIATKYRMKNWCLMEYFSRRSSIQPTILTSKIIKYGSAVTPLIITIQSILWVLGRMEQGHSRQLLEQIVPMWGIESVRFCVSLSMNRYALRHRPWPTTLQRIKRSWNLYSSNRLCTPRIKMD